MYCRSKYSPVISLIVMSLEGLGTANMTLANAELSSSMIDLLQISSEVTKININNFSSIKELSPTQKLLLRISIGERQPWVLDFLSKRPQIMCTSLPPSLTAIVFVQLASFYCRTIHSS